MANSYSIIEVATLALSRADQINSPTFDFNNEMIPYVRASMSQLYEVMVSRWVEWYTVPRPLSLLANVESYSLPSDFRAMQDVYLLYQGGQYREKLQGFTMEEFGRYSNENLWRRWPICYRIMRGQMYITPPSPQDLVNAIEFYYTPQYEPPILNYTPVDDLLPNGWEEWAVLDVMQKMYVKMRLPTDQIVAQKNEQFNRLLAAASIRDGEAPRMVDSTVYPRWVWLNSAPSGPLTWSLP